MYDYNAKVIRWIDGDTVVLHIDEGFGNWTTQHIRLLGVYCPKLSEPGGLEALARVEQLCPPESLVHVDTAKALTPIPVQNGRTFTRYLGSVRPTPDSESVQYTLIKEGLGTTTPAKAGA